MRLKLKKKCVDQLKYTKEQVATILGRNVNFISIRHIDENLLIIKESSFKG